MPRRYLFALLALLLVTGTVGIVAGAGTAAADPRPDSAPTPPAATAGTFVPVPQFRALDTRRAGGAVASGRGVTVRLAARHRIPANTAAVALTVHALAPTGAGVLTVFPDGTPLPDVANVSFSAGRSAAQAAIARLGRGSVRIVNRAKAARTQIVVDVSGYYVGGSVGRSQPGLLHSLVRPARALDATLAGHGQRTVQVAHGVPTSGVGAVAVMLSAVTPSRGGSLVAFAEGNDQPAVPTTEFTAGRTVTAFAWVPARNGSITIANTSSGRVRVLLDVSAWTDTGVAQVAGALQPRFPQRVVSAARVGGNRTLRVAVAGRAGVPRSDLRAVLVSVTAGAPAAAGSLAVWPGGAVPGTRAVQFSAGAPAAGMAEVPVSGGSIDVRNVSAGAVKLSVDVVGFVPATSLPVPAVSQSRYLGDLTGNQKHDETLMDQHGCDDALFISGPSAPGLVLLDVGAQSVSGRLTGGHPGVSLTKAAGTVRLRYPELVARIDSYLAGYARCAAHKAATIAIGTNNDGDWDSTSETYYAPSDRGTDWAQEVIDKIAQHPGITVIGADDIEPGFASAQSQAASWEQAYLTATQASLIVNGSADGCPDAFGVLHRACANGYSQQGLYDLAHNGSRIQVLPQIYGPSDAAKWANIDRTGGGKLEFAGVLTEHALDPESYTPSSGWAALHYAVATFTDAALPALSDLGAG